MSSQSSPESTTLSGSHQTSHDGTPAGVIAAVVVIMVVLTIGAAVYLVLRWRGRRTGYDPERRARAPMAVEGNHVPASTSPYGSTSNLVPHFHHVPGANMRIATRRPDGAWEFSNPGTPFKPLGVTEIEPPTPSCSYFPPSPSTLEPPKSPVEIMKERESKAARLIR